MSAIAMMVIGVMGYAQVELFEGSLSEAIAKAKADNKLVTVLASATW